MRSSANLRKAAVGSVPGDNTNSSGTVQEESAKHASRSTLTTKRSIPAASLSGRRHRRRSSCWKAVSVSKGAGGSEGRAGFATSCLHLPGDMLICTGSVWKASPTRGSLQALIQEGSALSWRCRWWPDDPASWRPSSPAPPPVSRNYSSS